MRAEDVSFALLAVLEPFTARKVVFVLRNAFDFVRRDHAGGWARPSPAARFSARPSASLEEGAFAVDRERHRALLRFTEAARGVAWPARFSSM